MAASSIEPTALAVLTTTPAALRLLVDGVPKDVVTAALDDGWSVGDVVAHLVDTEGGVIVARLKRILGEDRPFIRSIDPPARLAAAGYERRSIESLLAELEEQRVANVRWLESLTEAQLERMGEHDTAGEIRGLDIVHQWAYHDLMHLGQVGSMLQAALLERMGNTRRFYDV